MGCGGSKVDTTAQQRTAPVTHSSKTPQNIDEEAGSTGEKKRRNQPPVNEKGYKKRIRENLRHATAGDDIDILEKNMDTFEKNKLENGGDYDDAEERLDFLKTRKDIRDACMRRHPKVLEDSIARVEQSKYKRNLKTYLDRAYYLKQHQEDQKTFKHGISGLDQTTVSEVRSYHHPPEGVHETMIAVYMICGQKEQYLKDWGTVSGLMLGFGNHSLLKEVSEAEERPVDKDVALRAKHYLGAHSLEKIRESSNGAAAFHVWASRMVGHHEGNTNNNKRQTPSSGNRQQHNSAGTKPKTPSTPSKAPRDSVKDKKQMKEQENAAKQQQRQTKQQANQIADKTVKDNRQAMANTQNAKNARQTAQQVNSVANKSTRKG